MDIFYVNSGRNGARAFLHSGQALLSSILVSKKLKPMRDSTDRVVMVKFGIISVSEHRSSSGEAGEAYPNPFSKSSQWLPGTYTIKFKFHNPPPDTDFPHDSPMGL